MYTILLCDIFINTINNCNHNYYNNNYDYTIYDIHIY